MAHDDKARLVSLRERARLTGENVDSLRAAAQDGRLPGARHDNRKRWLVPLPDDVPRVALGGEALDLLQNELDEARADRNRLQATVADLHRQLGTAEGKLARAEEVTAGVRALVARLEADLDRERARADRLEALLTLPWWRRWFGR